MDEKNENSRLKRIADMTLADLGDLQTQASTDVPAEQGRTASEPKSGNSRLSHLTGLRQSDLRKIGFEEAPPSGEAPSDYDLSG